MNLRTITIGSAISVQGVFMKNLPGGRAVVRVHGKVFSGKLIPSVRREVSQAQSA